MNEFHDYLKAELTKLESPLKIQIVDDIGRKINYINLPHSTEELLEALAPCETEIRICSKCSHKFSAYKTSDRTICNPKCNGIHNRHK